MTEQEIKKQALQEMKNILQTTEEKDVLKKYKFIYGQWVKAKEEDVIIMPMRDVVMQKVKYYTFQAYRYYNIVYSNGSTSSRRNEPFELNSDFVNYGKTIYNIQKSGITKLEKEFYRKTVDQNEFYVIFNGSLGDAWTIKTELERVVENCYKRVNEVHLYNNPEKMVRIDFSNLKIDQYENIPLPYSAIGLKIKNKKGKPLTMYIGRYNELNRKIEKIKISKDVLLFNESLSQVHPYKTLFGWKV